MPPRGVARNRRATEMVLSAISNLQETSGSTIKRITSFISNAYNLDENEIKIPVATALRRGVAFGFLQKKGQHYRLEVDAFPDGSELARQHKRRKAKGKGKRRRSKSKGRGKRRR